jgi:hypothetical protein
MKTHVIKLDPHDDLTSIRDKMSWTKSPRILLVYPRRARVLSRTLDLRLLQHHAFALGGELAIAAAPEEVRLVAHDLDVPVFKTAAIAQRRTWEIQKAPEVPVRRAPRPDLRQMRREAIPEEAPWRNRLWFRLLLFTLAVLAVVALLVIYFPSATIVLTPETQTQSLTIPASASLKVTTVNPSGSFPARLAYATIEQSKTAPVTGSIISPKDPAAGMLSFRNLTTGEVKIPAGTVVSTTGNPPVSFATTSDAVMPAGAGKTLAIPAEAVKPGSSGNLPADSLVAFEEVDLGTSLAVTNPSPTIGGTDRSAPIQTAEDRASLRSALEAEILKQCKTSIPQSIAVGDVFFPDTLEAGEVLSETYFPADGQTGETLSLTMKLKCQAQYATAADMEFMARLAMDAKLPDGFAPASNAITITTSGTPVTNAEGITRWQVQAQRLLQARLDLAEAAKSIQGRSLETARQQLTKSLRLAAAPTINLTPSWWPWMPFVPFRIIVSAGG